MKDKTWLWLLGGMLTIFVAVAIGTTLLSVSESIAGAKDDSEESKIITTQTVRLKSINYKNETEDSFSLGYGIEGEIRYYVCYAPFGSSHVKLLKLEAEITTIHNTLPENKEAYVEIDSDIWGNRKAIRLYLPKNTIQVDYDFSPKEKTNATSRDT